MEVESDAIGFGQVDGVVADHVGQVGSCGGSSGTSYRTIQPLVSHVAGWNVPLVHMSG